MDIWGVAFGDYHTYTDWGLVLTGPVAVSLPVAQTNLIEIPGRSGPLDLSEALTGAPVYSSRTLQANLAALVAPEDWASMYASILNAIHGQRLQIVLDEDPDFYLTGRVTVEEPTWQDGFWRLTISAVCDPYRYVMEPSGATISITDQAREIVLHNLAMPAALTVGVTADTLLTWDGAGIALSAGSEVTLSRLLPAGDTVLTARTGNLLTLDGASGVHSGVTYTVDSSAGTVAADGTATSTHYRQIVSEFTLPAGTYLLSGCPEGGSTTDGYWLRLYVDVDGTTQYYGDTGAGREVVLDAERACRLFIAVRSGCEMDDVVFTPVLRSADGSITFAWQEGAL